METETAQRRVKITIPYCPRPLQSYLHERLARFSVLVCHRRFGKTVFAINELIKTGMTCDKQNPRVHYIAPQYKQAKRIAWDYVKHYSRAIPDIKINESELRVDYPSGGRLELIGADDPDSLRGTYSDHVVMDEYDEMSPRVWSEVLLPTLADRFGKAIFVGSVRGVGNLYSMYQYALDQDDWYRKVYRASDTGVIPESELATQRANMSASEYAREYECDWTASVEGAIYGQLMSDAEREGRICSVPYDPSIPVTTAWDLGIDSPTSIWFLQLAGAQIRAIDYAEYTGAGLPDILRDLLQTRKYIYGQHIAPHDIRVREFGSGRSRYQTAANLGVEYSIAPNLPIDEGIHAVSLLIPRMVFDEKKTALGVTAVRQYRRHYQSNGVYVISPRDKWKTHAADALRMFAVSSHDVQSGSPYSDWSIPING